MRISSNGIERGSAPFEFTFAGQPITAYAGESLAAALIAAGVAAFRTTHTAAKRGPFCGMGVCGECRVLVNGVPVRACMEPAAAGLAVEPAPPLAPANAAAAESARRPTGASSRPTFSSSAAARPDWRLPASPRQLASTCWSPMSAASPVANTSSSRRKASASTSQRSTTSSRKACVCCVPRAIAARRSCPARRCGVHSRPTPIAAVVDGRTQLIRAKRVILATGAYERAVPVPGWTTPGVMTTGAAQTLLRAYQVAPGRRILIAGNGPLNLQVAHELVASGRASRRTRGSRRVAISERTWCSVVDGVDCARLARDGFAPGARGATAWRAALLSSRARARRRRRSRGERRNCRHRRDRSHRRGHT